MGEPGPSTGMLHVLAVGLEGTLRDELRTALRGHPLAVCEAEDAESALSLAAQAPVDAILVQPRLRGGSGNSLLGAFKRDFPEVVRLMLIDSGHDALGLAALDNLHRALYRPLDGLALMTTLRSLRALRVRLASPSVAAAIGRIGRLPSPPDLTLELMRRSEAEDVSARDLAELVERDPALAAKVLRLCNSALYSGGQSIRDIRSAIVRLGSVTLRRLVMAGEVFGGGRDRVEAAELARLRDTSLRASRLAQRLLGDERADLAATAALIAQVGRLLPGVLEREDCSVADAGAYLLALWGLPDVLVQAAAWNSTPALAGEVGLDIVGATHVAWALLGEHALDEAWLEAAGLSEFVPVWRGLADEVSGVALD